MNSSEIPLTPNPNGDPPNFAAGPNLGSTFLAPGLLFCTLSACAVVVRFYTTFRFSPRWFTDDWLCLITTILGIANWSMVYMLARAGMAKHKWDIPLSALTPRVLKLATAHEILGMMGLLAAKVLMAAFFIRLFGTVRWLRITCYTLCALAVVAFGSYIVVYLAACVPHNGAQWDIGLIGNKCAHPRKVSSIATYSFSVVADLILFIIPFPIIAKLTLSKEKKRGLAVVFFFGLMIVATSAVGLAFRIMGQLETTTRDESWMRSNITITTYSEILGTILVSCAPAIFSFWSKVVAKSNLYYKLRGTEPPPHPSRGYHLPDDIYMKSKGKTLESNVHPAQLPGSLTSSTGDLIAERRPTDPLKQIQKSVVIRQNITRIDDLNDAMVLNDQRTWEMGAVPGRGKGW
ncbi:hypothetical protein QBC43DRAFT_319115 [Cladorrhinum sp. PSN259]|nr:hypothetical protein QBC43DRAFT_319115 [Cladorrhinum sp. PSN259]